ncbi:class I SAM-dependent methyltransferase [Microbacterium sp.]|uniref:class I SAM-dependent methyltransferase n=1 Tax=Microbacterium sp. TaxID=51671 RepID=UPI003F95C070
MSDDFDQNYWEGHWSSDAQGGHRMPPHPSLEREIRDLAPGTALDAGSGEGAEAAWLADRDWQVIAADISTEALRRAQAPGESRKRITWLHADLTTWQPAEPFDLVTTFYAHPTIGQLAFYRRLADWVQAGGTLLIVGHSHSQGDSHSAADHPPGATAGVAEVTALLDAAHWTVHTAEERDRTTGDPRGSQVTLQDVIVRATRR